MNQPDLRTKEGAAEFLNYHAPDEGAVKCHEEVNHQFQRIIIQLWDFIPDGPGKTRFIHALDRARMVANSTIANGGA